MKIVIYSNDDGTGTSDGKSYVVFAPDRPQADGLLIATIGQKEFDYGYHRIEEYDVGPLQPAVIRASSYYDAALEFLKPGVFPPVSL